MHERVSASSSWLRPSAATLRSKKAVPDPGVGALRESDPCWVHKRMWTGHHLHLGRVVRVTRGGRIRIRLAANPDHELEFEADGQPRGEAARRLGRLVPASEELDALLRVQEMRDELAERVRLGLDELPEGAVRLARAALCSEGGELVAAVVAAAVAHLEASGACEHAAGDGAHCDRASCTYCALSRAADDAARGAHLALLRPGATS